MTSFFSDHAVEISHRAVNPPTQYKHFSISGIPHGKNRRFLFMFCIDVIKFTAL
jgi:hypothetical protein